MDPSAVRMPRDACGKAMVDPAHLAVPQRFDMLMRRMAGERFQEWVAAHPGGA